MKRREFIQILRASRPACYMERPTYAGQRQFTRLAGAQPPIFTDFESKDKFDSIEFDVIEGGGFQSLITIPKPTKESLAPIIAFLTALAERLESERDA